MDQCDRCHASSCTLSHMFIYCPRIHKFWTDFFEILTRVLGIRIRMDPLIAIFGTPTEQLHVGSLQLEVLAFTSLLARHRILLMWKSPNPPSISVWLKDVMFFIKLEKITLSVKGCSIKFTKKLNYFIIYFNSLSTLPQD